MKSNFVLAASACVVLALLATSASARGGFVIPLVALAKVRVVNGPAGETTIKSADCKPPKGNLVKHADGELVCELIVPHTIGATGR